MCLLCVWHAIVGAFWAKPDAIVYDQALLITFSIIFILIHTGLIVWYLNAYRKILRVKKEEFDFINKLENQMKNKKNIELSRV